MPSSSLARSVTVRVIGPICAVGTGWPSHIPLRLMRPGVARMPASAPQAAGRLSEELVSSPSASSPKFAASAPPDPPEEPPTVRSGAYGLREYPVRALYV